MARQRNFCPVASLRVGGNGCLRSSCAACGLLCESAPSVRVSQYDVLAVWKPAPSF